MSLLKPTPGELIDRIWILELKIAAYKKSGRDALGLEIERSELRRYLAHFGPGQHAKTSARKLERLHQDLWQAEDEIRSPLSDKELLRVARDIARLNDRRSRLIQAIDRAYGVPSVEEKIYR